MRQIGCRLDNPGAIDQLVQSGLVERREDPCDRRHKLVTLTPPGAEIVARVRQARLEETARRFADLSPDLLARLDAVLTEVLDALNIAATAPRL